MTQPPSASPSSNAGAGIQRPVPASNKTWFRTREGHRYGTELALIIVVKLALLAVLWFVLIEPWPRPATPPAAAVQQLYAPAAPAGRHD